MCARKPEPGVLIALTIILSMSATVTVLAALELVHLINGRCWL